MMHGNGECVCAIRAHRRAGDTRLIQSALIAVAGVLCLTYISAFAFGKANHIYPLTVMYVGNVARV